MQSDIPPNQAPSEDLETLITELGREDSPRENDRDYFTKIQQQKAENGGREGTMIERNEDREVERTFDEIDDKMIPDINKMPKVSSGIDSVAESLN